MEVFLHNVPNHLSSQSLEVQLIPFMRELRIVDFFCDKPRKKRFGHITFFSKEDAQHFLAVHGQEELPTLRRGRPQLKSHLLLLGTDVFCKPSNRDPVPIALRALEYQKQQRERGEQREEDGRPHIKINMDRFSCGYGTFADDDLVYTPEVAWSRQGVIEIKGRNFFVMVGNEYQIRIPMATVVALIYGDDGLITLTLSDVPFFFRISTKPPVTDMMAELSLKAVKEITHVRLPALGDDHSAVVGQCLVYQFHTPQAASVDRIQSLLELNFIPYRLLCDGSSVHASKETFTQHLGIFQTQLGEWMRLGSLSFQMLYQLQALVFNAYLHPRTVLELGHRLCTIDQDRKDRGTPSLSILAVRDLFDLIDWPLPFGSPRYFQDDALVDAIKENEHIDQQSSIKRAIAADLQSDQCLVHRVQVTPTRIMFRGPEIEPQNRILRMFPRHHDYFVRVQFCDENGGELFFPFHQDYSDIFNRFEDVMKDGITIAGRTYSFLGFSHSSLRSHAVWFASPLEDADGYRRTPTSIIQALGNFLTITSPARCAARIGQAFSETPFTLRLADGVVQQIPDIISADGSRVFSDGIGTVSRDIVHRIWAGIPLNKGTPTCFQVRLGGAKGMVVLDPNLAGSAVRVRPSMVKFQTDDVHVMGICNMASEPYPLVLNRQLIKILEDMGVPDDWFFQLQGARLHQLRVITANADKTATFLLEGKVSDAIGLHRLFRHCYWMDANYQDEPFLRSVVQAVVLRELRLLKHKARIPVRQGMTLYGVIDDTGLLEENEVYITFDTCGGRHCPPPDAERVLVARSPALHDGDIQVARSIRPPTGHPLGKLKNCIVFSQRGQRDLPSQLTGGDLDGDLYHVIWDPITQNVQTSPPADYPRVKPLDIGRPVTGHDMAHFFVEFMNTDRLGMIATRHMVLADQRPKGTHDPDCRELAALHSTAVDYSKTGIPVDMVGIPKVGRWRPDFMASGPLSQVYSSSKIILSELSSHAAYRDDTEQSSILYYRSDKVLGKLYRAIDEKQIWYEHLYTDIPPNPATFWDMFSKGLYQRYTSLQSLSWGNRESEAQQLQCAYNEAVLLAMHDFSDHPTRSISELEVVIGIVITPTGVQSRRQRDRSMKLKDEFDRISSWITAEIRRGGVDLCFACVHLPIVSERKAARYNWQEHGPLQSFRVVAACSLLAELEGRKQSRGKYV